MIPDKKGSSPSTGRIPSHCDKRGEQDTTYVPLPSESSSLLKRESFKYDSYLSPIHGEQSYDPSTSNTVARETMTFDSYRSRPAFAEHLGKHRQYWRDIILGVNDGLVSTFLLVTGVAGGGMSTKDILLTAISGAIAGAISMCAGEFVATKSQDEVLRGEIDLESSHIRNYPSDELEELSELLPLIGINNNDDVVADDDDGGDEVRKNDIHHRLLEYYKSSPESLLKIMVALEFGVLEEERRSPCYAGLTSCGLFFLGSLPSVVPFAYFTEPMDGLAAAAIGTGLSLFLVGAVKSWATRGTCARAAVENLFIAGFGGAIAYGVGVLFDRSI